MPGIKDHRSSLAIPRQRPFYISFSGMDGSGKTTQIDALLVSLCNSGLRVRVFRFWDDIAVAGTIRETLSHKLFKSEKGVGAPDQPVQRRDKNVRGWYMTAARLFLYLLDATRLTFVIATTSRKDVDVVIFDRHLYDQVVNLDLHKAATCAYARLLLKIVPHPDVAFLLDADPVAARARKPEYPLEFLQSIRNSYLELAQSSELTVIAPLPPEDVTRTVMRAMPRPLLWRATDDCPYAFSRRRSHQ